MTTVTLVDLGYGNLGSLQHAFRRAGAETRRSSDPAEIEAADRILLPGVGAAGFAMTRIQELGLGDALRGFPRPALGICLGMHLLFEGSEEGSVASLGILPGQASKLQPAPGFTVPHMGWSRLDVADGDIGLNSGDYVYFAHSYAVDDGPATVARAHHGRPIPAVVKAGPWTGAQFHPERSGPAGLRFLQAWLAS